MRVTAEPPAVVQKVLCAAVAVLGAPGLEKHLGKNLMDVPKEPQAEKALWALVQEQCVLNPNHPRYFLAGIAQLSELNATSTHASAFKVRPWWLDRRWSESRIAPPLTARVGLLDDAHKKQVQTHTEATPLTPAAASSNSYSDISTITKLYGPALTSGADGGGGYRWTERTTSTRRSARR
jgi:hypothetical protein